MNTSGIERFGDKASSAKNKQETDHKHKVFVDRMQEETTWLISPSWAVVQTQRGKT